MMDPSEGRFLTYIALRIDDEVARCQRCAQSVVQTRVNLDRLARCALDADSDEAGRGFRFEGGHRSDLKPARSDGVCSGSWWMIVIGADQVK